MLSSYFEISDSLLLLNLIVNAPDDHLVWADEVLRTHQQHRVIVVTHNWLGPISDETGDKGGTDRKNGEAIIGIMQKKHAQRNSLIPHCKCGINLYQITRIY
jgi:hypothetical protein